MGMPLVLLTLEESVQFCVNHLIDAQVTDTQCTEKHDPHVRSAQAGRVSPWWRGQHLAGACEMSADRVMCKRS